MTVAHRLKVGFVPVRKRGKLPGATFRQEYALEYGTDCVELEEAALNENDKVVIIDDLIATGGTLKGVYVDFSLFTKFSFKSVEKIYLHSTAPRILEGKTKFYSKTNSK